MDIAALSTALSQGKIAQQASISVLRMSMDTALQQANDFTQMLQAQTKALELSVQPHLGSNLDIRI